MAFICLAVSQAGTESELFGEAEVVAQGGSLVIVGSKATAAQDRHDLVDEIIEPVMQVIDYNGETVGGACFHPFLEHVGSLFSSSDETRVQIEDSVSEDLPWRQTLAGEPESSVRELRSGTGS